MVFIAVAMIYLGAFAADVYLTLHGHWMMGLACLVCTLGVSATTKSKGS